jgi:hypothetical protein
MRGFTQVAGGWLPIYSHPSTQGSAVRRGPNGMRFACLSDLILSAP